MTFKYRKLDADGDMVFGRGLADYYIDTPLAVGQAAMTRLQLYLSEWFLDTSDGTDWNARVLGKYTSATRDIVIRERVLGTPFVESIEQYQSQYDGVTRRFTVAMTISTSFGLANLSLQGESTLTGFVIGEGAIGTGMIG